MNMNPLVTESLPEVWYLYDSKTSRPIYVFAKGRYDSITFQRAVYLAFERELESDDIERGYIESDLLEIAPDGEPLRSEENILAGISKKRLANSAPITLAKLRRPTFIQMRR